MSTQNDDKKNTAQLFWEGLWDIILYPIHQIVQNRIRMDGHTYVEIRLPGISCNIKFCIATIWVILYIIYVKL